MSRAEIKRVASEIRRVLNEDWDPIGGGTPADEYDDFVWHVFGQLIDGAPAEQIARYLQFSADESMKCPLPAERTAAVVVKLMAIDLGDIGETSS